MRYLIAVVLFLSCCCPVYALDQKYVERILKGAAWHQKNRTSYIWGSTDCSGVMHDIYFNAGLPVLRSTAYAMSLGRDGWNGTTITRSEATPADLVMWNVLNYKPSMGKLEKNHPHVGLKTSSKTIAHASGGRKYFLEDPIESPWGKKIEVYRRLTIGDK